MAQLGNVWHIPANPEPPGVIEGMRSPVSPTDVSPAVTLRTGNQFAGGGNPGNQLEVGSLLWYRHAGEVDWTSVQLEFDATVGTNKYYAATVPLSGLAVGSELAYYFEIAYDDHDTTFVGIAPDGTTSQAVETEALARAATFSFTIGSRDALGEWSEVFDLPNVGIHAHLLRTGKVLLWGRRDSPDQSLSVDPVRALTPGGALPPPATSTPFVWDPDTKTATVTPMPELPDGTPANLFCSGHAFLPDGSLLVAGGHLADSSGLTQTTVYDPGLNTWTPSASMSHSRWYPTLTTLPDGGVFILSGDPTAPNPVPEIWRGGVLTEVANKSDGPFDLYPRMHTTSTGLVVTTGALQQTWAFDPASGTWAKDGTGRPLQLDYAASVLFDGDTVMYIGGGTAPTPATNTANLGAVPAVWEEGASMAFPRRQHNATILADGSVLVTGGTRSGGANQPETFNNLDPGQPVHVAELWDPVAKRWDQVAAESIDRCYHSTAVLLPDGTVLSAGGGEFFPIEDIDQENDPADTHRDAQVFSPPYLFKGARPVIDQAPSAVTYGQQFHVSTEQPATIAKVTWIRLSSVTHSFNTGQRFASLAFAASAGGDGIDATAPPDAASSPPGYYLLFLISEAGVPSVASITVIGGPSPVLEHPHFADAAEHPDGGPVALPLLAMRRREPAPAKLRVLVGLTGTCPYGIGACWGGANEALQRLDGVVRVDPIPDGPTSTATVYLSTTKPPALEAWRDEFRALVNQSYGLRGLEVTLTGTVRDEDGLVLQVDDDPPLRILPLDPNDKVQWDRTHRRPELASPAELEAYAELQRAVHETPRGTFSITGPVAQHERHAIEVRAFE